MLIAYAGPESPAVAPRAIYRPTFIRFSSINPGKALGLQLSLEFSALEPRHVDLQTGRVHLRHTKAQIHLDECTKKTKKNVLALP